MSTTQHERSRVGLLERSPGVRTAPNGESFDHKFVASTELLASDHGVIYVSGWRWDRYMQRPRWIANHDLHGFSGKLTEVSLGKAVYVGVESALDPQRVGPSGRALVVCVRYAPTDFAAEVRALYDAGALDDVSVRWDWRTEVTRNPFEEEVQKFGEDLHWVCERADLVELSAVMLGADSGAQIVRENLEGALARVRSATGRRFPHVEQYLRRIAPITVRVTSAPSDTLPGALKKPFAGYPNMAACVVANDDQPHPLTYCAGLAPKKKTQHADDAIDVVAAADVMQGAEQALIAIAAGLQTLADAQTEIANLVSKTAEAPDDDAEPTAAADAMHEMNVALATTLSTYGQLGNAWAKLYAVLDIPETLHGLNAPVDIAAVAKDMLMHRLTE